MSQVTRENTKRFGNAADAAVILNVSPATIARLLKSDNAPPSIKIGAKRMFPLDELEAWRDAQITGRTGPAAA